MWLGLRAHSSVFFDSVQGKAPFHASGNGIIPERRIACTLCSQYRSSLEQPLAAGVGVQHTERELPCHAAIAIRRPQTRFGSQRTLLRKEKHPPASRMTLAAVSGCWQRAPTAVIRSCGGFVWCCHGQPTPVANLHPWQASTVGTNGQAGSKRDFGHDTNDNA